MEKEAYSAERLHCLTHPGFSMYTSQTVKPADKILFDRYREVAESLTPRDAMIALLWMPLSQRKEHERFVSERIVSLKEKLRGRMLVMSHGLRLFKEEMISADLVRARLVLASRGINIGPSTECLAYGETMSSCVPDFAKKIRNMYGLKRPAVIPAHYTNVGVRPDETPGQERERFRVIEEQRYLPDVVVDWSVPGS